MKASLTLGKVSNFLGLGIFTTLKDLFTGKLEKEDFQNLVLALTKAASFTAVDLKNIVTAFVDESNRSFGDLLPLLRLAIAGDTKGPDLFEMMETLGRSTTLARLQSCGESFEKALATAGN